ncbi:MAG: sulfatase-like hydrolase/transferase [Thermoanaerobaculia bacterium]
MALLFSAFSSRSSAAAARRPNILLIVVDTLRYDATSFGDPRGGNTPFLAFLASRGVVFTNTYSTHDFTPPSHFSIMTGFSEGWGTRLDRQEFGVPFQLARAGYDTFATAGNQLVDPSTMPTLRGFKTFRGVHDIDAVTIPILDLTEVDRRLRLFGCRPTNRNRAMIYYSADRLLTVFLDQIRKAREPYFGFVNLLDPHEPYAPDPNRYPRESDLPPGFDGDVMARTLPADLKNPGLIKATARREYVQQKIAQVRFPKLLAIDLPDANRQIYRHRYLAKVREVDEKLGQFFAVLEHEHRLANTVVIITSDHGEAFGEDDVITHMFGDNAAFEVTHHVPLLIVMPAGMGGKAARIDRRVSIANIASSIYALAGVDAAPLRSRVTSEARSLVSLFALVSPPDVNFALPPDDEAADDAAAQEMKRSLSALGYIQP